MNTEMMNYTQTDKHSENELNLYADWWIQQRWTVILQTDEDSKDELYADWRTQKMNYMQTDKHRRWTICRLTNTEDELYADWQTQRRWMNKKNWDDIADKEERWAVDRERKEMKIEMGWTEVRAIESSDKESVTECQKILSSPLRMPTTSSNNPQNAVGEQRGVTRSRPAGNIKNNFSVLWWLQQWRMVLSVQATG